MSQGKYSPTVRDNPRGEYVYNAKGELPSSDGPYNEETDFADYDEHGYDYYGYSCYDEDGAYVGMGNGIDRNGYSEMQYLMMSTEEYDEHCY